MKGTALAATAIALGLAAAPAPDRFNFSRRDVTERVVRSRPERAPAWERIPWAASMAEARRAAARESVPLFVFTYDGNVRSGRC